MNLPLIFENLDPIFENFLNFESLEAILPTFPNLDPTLATLDNIETPLIIFGSIVTPLNMAKGRQFAHDRNKMRIRDKKKIFLISFFILFFPIQA